MAGLEVRKTSATRTGATTTHYPDRIRVVKEEKEDVVCAICNFTAHTDITKHIKLKHGLTQAEYTEKFPNHKVRIDRDKLGHLCRMLIDPTVSDSKFIEEFKVTFKKKIEEVIREKEKAQVQCVKRVSFI